MFQRISRSWMLAGQCWQLLKQDPALLLFPLFSSLALIALMASFALPVFTFYHSLQPVISEAGTTHTSRLLFYLTMYLFYVLSYAVIMFFNSALIAVALRRLDGDEAGVGEGLRTAWSNLPAILGYAMIAATVGMIVRAIEERVGFVGRLVMALIGAAWTLATAMTLPVLVVESVGPIQGTQRSLDLLRSNWGENLIGNGGISIGIAVIAVPVVLLGFFFMMSAIGSHSAGMIILAGLLFVAILVTLSLVSSTLHSIYTAALYRFATGAPDHGVIGEELLAGAFRRK